MSELWRVRVDALASLQHLNDSLHNCGPACPQRRSTLLALADTHALLKDHRSAFKAHKAAHDLLMRDASPADLAISLTTLASGHLRSVRFDAALRAVGRALQMALPPSAQRILLLLEADIHECKSDPMTGLLRMEQALKIAPASLGESLRHIKLLGLVQRSGDMPRSVNLALQEQRDRRRHELSLRGCSSPWQLPQECVVGLDARPWHEPAEHGPKLLRAAELLRAATGALQKEYSNLLRGRKLMREQECIHDAQRGSASAWLRYEITAVWRPLLPTGCSEDTPQACALFDAINSSIPLLRAGFSSVGAGAWLQPHHGTTNGQLKLHLGLRVPGGNGSERCATLRVGDTSRGWSEGELTMFDDSFEHEVHNSCSHERVIFQVVLRHPGLWDTMVSKPHEEL